MKSFLLSLLAIQAFANPYPDPRQVPQDSTLFFRNVPLPELRIPDATGSEVIRVDIAWEKGEKYSLVQIKRELSGTDALIKRSPHQDPMGSFQGRIVDTSTQQVVGIDAVGIGTDFRTLTRGMSFRFPFTHQPLRFELIVENPSSGKMEQVYTHKFFPDILLPAEPANPAPQVRQLRTSNAHPPLIVTITSEGYLASRESQFWKDAARVVTALETNNFPGLSSMEFRGVFVASPKAIGAAKNLGEPIPEWNSFLGLYFPYWADLQRWYHIVYPTREVKFRDGLGQVAYDYPIVLIDDSNYWGVGNYKELTAIPAGNASFTYLLLHELGHFFGLNEEYEGGGKTELAFAPQISEPWSQNISFLSGGDIKWKKFVAPSTPIPTPASHWSAGRYGAYKGGYAQTPPFNRSHKPGLDCVMNNRKNFCDVCRHAIEERIAFDTGQKFIN